MSALDARRSVVAAGCTAGTVRLVDADTPVDATIANDADLEAIAGELGGHRSIALVFPKWTDGRAYSQARLLRVRYRFGGEIRATGDVVVDMLPLLARTGFDAAALRADQTHENAARATSFFAEGHYQGDVVEPLPRFARNAEVAP